MSEEIKLTRKAFDRWVSKYASPFLKDTNAWQLLVAESQHREPIVVWVVLDKNGIHRDMSYNKDTAIGVQRLCYPDGRVIKLIEVEENSISKQIDAQQQAHAANFKGHKNENK